ncbi:DUF1439 domain-containing protein [Thalassotalea sp. M1531]|uniref:DUF1439 domain-containing protein n=1 Tax=Thalassotalea algicola TaxID=2716224 RepID=A0A7Y0LCU7_9GAMM|nr:DUF1439 domain-containing protein [Thalassotalea algicola]NMP30775.1 DUF1439 domain-containing protein [Thalassotalea algicola]
MNEHSSLWQRAKHKLNSLLIRLMIRFKCVREVKYSQQELNEMLATNFPHSMSLSLPGSQGMLTLLNAELSMPSDDSHLHIQLFCGFTVSVAGHDIYRAHLLVVGTVTPYYVASEKSIRLKQMQLTEVRLVNDDYAFIGSSTQIATLFMPKAFKYLLATTVHIGLSLLKGLIPSELMNYLGLYSNGSKQSVLDYHKPEIERLIIAEVEQDDWCYQLDETDFEEQLFAELGQEIAVENGFLVFKFHLD